LHLAVYLLPIEYFLSISSTFFYDERLKIMYFLFKSLPAQTHISVSHLGLCQIQNLSPNIFLDMALVPNRFPCLGLSLRDRQPVLALHLTLL